MKNLRKKLPIGIENFETMIREDYYYVDKTGLIADLLNAGGLVTLFTRPRRFGKSLNMSMLEQFFDPETDKSIFEGLKSREETQLCEKYMGQYPVISISLKRIEAGDFDTAYAQMAQIIREQAIRADNLVAQGTDIHPADRSALDRLLADMIKPADLYAGLYTLSGILEKHYGRKIVLLIDEYDVPLSKACEYGYYDQMVLLIRNLLHQAMKTNHNLQLAVLTGCMRISKESIFTGLNNLKVLGVSDARSDEYFGFTDQEVRDLLTYYGLSERYEEVREWYDGYHFGNVDVYCPWDVINYCDHAVYDPNAYPENYWINSSNNQIIRRFLRYNDSPTLKSEIETLINGGEVEKTIHQELTYGDMYSSLDNIWSVLFTTGYLTQSERMDARRFRLRIPNEEIRDIFTEQILDLFVENVRRDGTSLGLLCDALKAKDALNVEKYLTDYLRRTISIRDTAVRKSLRENFYHGLLLGILGACEDWGVSSNPEAGDGYSDLIVRLNNYEMAMVIEVKYADDGDMEAVCRRALDQIEEKRYIDPLLDDGFERILKYGIAFYKKRCRVMVREG